VISSPQLLLLFCCATTKKSLFSLWLFFVYHRLSGTLEEAGVGGILETSPLTLCLCLLHSYLAYLLLFPIFNCCTTAAAAGAAS
jgi:hypothetical protein